MKGLLSLIFSPILLNYIERECQLDSYSTAKIVSAVSSLTDEISATYERLCADSNRMLYFQKVDYNDIWLELQDANPIIDNHQKQINIEFHEHTSGMCSDVSTFFTCVDTASHYTGVLIQVLFHNSKDQIKHMLLNTPLACISRSRQMKLEQKYLNKRVQQRDVQYLLLMMDLYRRFLEKHTPYEHIADLQIGATVASLRTLFRILRGSQGIEGQHSKEPVPDFISMYFREEDIIEIDGCFALDVQSVAAYTVIAWNNLVASTKSPQKRRMIFNENFILENNLSLLRGFVGVLRFGWTRGERYYKKLFSVVCIYDFIYDYSVLSEQECDIRDIRSALVELILR